MMLENKIAVITGAARGIGLACAQRFVRERARVILSDILDEAGERAAEALRAEGGDALYHRCDVTDPAAVRALMDFAVQRHGRIDTVIANAGIVHAADILDLEVEDFDRVLGVNLRGVFLTGQAAARRMVTQNPDADGCRGVIINMSSLNAVLAIPAIAPYVIAKGGVNQWTKCLGIRLAGEGVRVNGIGPAPSTPICFGPLRTIRGDCGKCCRARRWSARGSPMKSPESRFFWPAHMQVTSPARPSIPMAGAWA